MVGWWIMDVFCNIFTKSLTQYTTALTSCIPKQAPRKSQHSWHSPWRVTVEVVMGIGRPLWRLRGKMQPQSCKPIGYWWSFMVHNCTSMILLARIFASEECLINVYICMKCKYIYDVWKYNNAYIPLFQGLFVETASLLLRDFCPIKRRGVTLGASLCEAKQRGYAPCTGWSWSKPSLLQ